MKTVAQNIAFNIKRRRKELGLTQFALASSLGYSEKTISKWECADGVPPTVLLPELARCLETSVDSLLYESEKQRYYLGIDGGGTKTDFALSDEDGNIIKRVSLGATNPNDVGIADSKEVIRRGIFLCTGERPLSSIYLFAGVAGSSTKEIHDELMDFLLRLGFARVRIGSDAENAIATSLGKNDGVAVIMGTGSVVFAKKGKELYRVGGYGYLLGDAGSGFAIGRDAILAALQYEDGSGPNTTLYKYVKELFGTDTVLAGLDGIYRGGKRYVAKYAPTVFRAYSDGDEVAREILERNLSAMAKIIKASARKLDDKRVKVGLCGGICTSNEVVLPILSSMLEDDDKEYDMDVCREPLVFGALLLAKTLSDEVK